MKFLQGKFFKDIFLGLCEEQEKYYICYGKTGPVKFKFQNDYKDIIYRDVSISKFLMQSNASIQIPFIQKNNCLFHFQSIKNKEDYYTILSVLEELL